MKILTATNDKALNAGPKAKMDVIKFLSTNKDVVSQMVFLTDKSLDNEKNSLMDKLRNYYGRIKIILKNMFFNDIILVQYPLINTPTVLNLLPKNKTIILIHDLQGLRLQNKDIEKKELKILNKFPCIIVHNNKMKEYLLNNNIKSKLIVLDLFDYYVNDSKEKKNIILDRRLKNEIVYVGNLSKIKTPFLYQIDSSKINFCLNLYGVGINNDINNKMLYQGSFLPDEIPLYLKGNLGLVWDGNYDESDEKIKFKNYLKYNNPHKLSCYISANIPVIVWEKSAVADFVRENDIGYTIKSIYDINELDLSDYEIKLENVKKIAVNLKNGFYINEAVKKAIQYINEQSN